jgi:hypothetical protein
MIVVVDGVAVGEDVTPPMEEPRPEEVAIGDPEPSPIGPTVPLPTPVPVVEVPGLAIVVPAADAMDEVPAEESETTPGLDEGSFGAGGAPVANWAFGPATTEPEPP